MNKFYFEQGKNLLGVVNTMHLFKFLEKIIIGKGDKSMIQRSAVFDKNYEGYVEQLSKINFKSIEERLGIRCHDDEAQIDFLTHLCESNL